MTVALDKLENRMKESERRYRLFALVRFNLSK